MEKKRIGRRIIRQPTEAERQWYRQAVEEERAGMEANKALGRELLAQRKSSSEEPRSPRQLGPEEAWRITCHEAGHAVFALRRGIPFMQIERGEGEHGEVVVGVNPVSDPDAAWSASDISKWQEFYAAGAAAERLLFEADRPYANRIDISRHNELEQKRHTRRSNGFEDDVQSAMQVLDKSSIEKVATELDQQKVLASENVAQIVGCPLPW